MKDTPIANLNAARALAEEHHDTPFTLTPGSRRVCPRFHPETGNFYVAPLVVLAIVNGQALVKQPNGGIYLLPHNAAIENVTPHEWARCLWNLTANQRKAAA